MSHADHWLHVEVDDDRAYLSLSCMDGDPDAHVCLTERSCTCECDACVGDDHWGCTRQVHDYSLDGRAPCETEYDSTTCWALELMESPENYTVGKFPRDGAPWPVTVRYLGDGEVEIEYVPVEVYGECDWGGCNRDAVAYRTDPHLGRLPVCAEHRSEAEHVSGAA